MTNRFFSGTLKNLRFGLHFEYGSLGAKDVSEVSLDFLSLMFSSRYSFVLASEGFFSGISPFLHLGLGGSLIKLTKSSNSTEAGINPSILIGMGVDFSLSSRFNTSISFDYFSIVESSESLQELRLGAGFVFKF